MSTKLFLIFLAVFFTFSAYAEIAHLDDAFVFATKEEMKDLPKLLKQIDLEPAPSEDGQNLLRVKRVSKGSIYDRMGIKVGDLVQASDTYVRPTEADFESSLQ